MYRFIPLRISFHQMGINYVIQFFDYIDPLIQIATLYQQRKTMIISKKRLIEVCEKNKLGLVVNSPPGVEEIMDGFLKIGEAIYLFDNDYDLLIYDITYEKLFE